jgi:serine/threonine protein kinase
MKAKEINDKLSTEEKLMVDFVRRCLEIDPTKRMTCDEAIRHAWFKELLIKTEKEIDDKIKEIINDKEQQQDLQEICEEKDISPYEQFSPSPMF